MRESTLYVFSRTGEGIVFVYIAERQKQARPVPVPIRGAEVRVSRASPHRGHSVITDDDVRRRLSRGMGEMARSRKPGGPQTKPRHDQVLGRCQHIDAGGFPAHNLPGGVP